MAPAESCLDLCATSIASVYFSLAPVFRGERRGEGLRILLGGQWLLPSRVFSCPTENQSA